MVADFLLSTSASNKLTNMASQELNYSDFGSLTSINCSNLTTIDFSNASTTVMNSFIYYNVSNFAYNSYATHQFGILMLCVAFCGLITNSSFVVTVVKTPSLHTTTYILLTSLACSDCVVLITRVFLFGHTLFTGNVIPFDPATINTSMTLSECFNILCFLLSTGFVILVSAERYLAICHPLTHHRLKETKRTPKLIIIVFLISVAILSTYVSRLLLYSKTRICIIWSARDDLHVYSHQVLIPKPSRASWLRVYNKVFDSSLGVMYLLILASISYMYANILATLAKRKRNTNLQMSAEFKKHIEQVSLMVIVNGGVYFLLTSILIIYVILASLSFIDSMSLGYWQLAALTSYGVNASINPLLYLLTNERYRCVVKNMFRCSFRKRNLPNAIEHRF